MPPRSDLIKEQIWIKNSWRVYFVFWYAVHYLLGMTAVVLSVTVAAKPFQLSQDSKTYSEITWLLAVVTGLIAFFNPEGTGNRHQRAFRLLSTTITRFLANQTYTVDDVLAAYERGEDIIHQSADHERAHGPSGRSPDTATK